MVAHGSAAQAPEWFTTAPALALESTVHDAGWKKSDVDLWEINEAFSCVTMACAQIAGIDLERVNVHGGAVALGHPIGATGARISTTLLHALVTHEAKRGLATLCIGGGEALAIAFERP
jgi:acetyl-CoA C-acetyltransferase